MDGSPSAGAKLGNAETGITLGERGLELPLPDGTRGYFNYYWLRDNCATSFDRETRERTYDIFQDSEPRPAGAHSDGEALEIVWHGSGHVTRHRLDWLAAYASGLPRPDPAELPRRLWYAGHYPKIARLAQCDLLRDKALVGPWAEALLVEGIAIVTDMPASDAGLTAIGHPSCRERGCQYGK